MKHDALAAILGGMPYAMVEEPLAEGVPGYKVAGKIFPKECL